MRYTLTDSLVLSIFCYRCCVVLLLPLHLFGLGDLQFISFGRNNNSYLQILFDLILCSIAKATLTLKMNNNNYSSKASSMFLKGVTDLHGKITLKLRESRKTPELFSV